ncbi:MAG TPA: hypothetical protein VJU78_15285 [Chitinophagaceae bacterium]|nr:hypothetical protein [Chitinophagaceae bacterium]
MAPFIDATSHDVNEVNLPGQFTWIGTGIVVANEKLQKVIGLKPKLVPPRPGSCPHEKSLRSLSFALANRFVNTQTLAKKQNPAESWKYKYEA